MNEVRQVGLGEARVAQALDVGGEVGQAHVGVGAGGDGQGEKGRAEGLDAGGGGLMALAGEFALTGVAGEGAQ